MYNSHFLLALHHLAGILFMAGVILLLAWAIKNLKKDDLKKTGIWFVVIGLVLMAITCTTRGGDYYRHGKYKKHMMDGNKIIMEDVGEEAIAQ